MAATTPLDDPSARHLDRIVGEILADRTPAPVAAIRLEAAAHLGRVLDGEGAA